MTYKYLFLFMISPSLSSTCLLGSNPIAFLPISKSGQACYFLKALLCPYLEPLDFPIAVSFKGPSDVHFSVVVQSHHPCLLLCITFVTIWCFVDILLCFVEIGLQYAVQVGLELTTLHLSWDYNCGPLCQTLEYKYLRPRFFSYSFISVI